MIDIPPVWLLVCAGLVLWLGALGGPGFGWLPRWIAWVPIGAGVALAALSAVEFARHRTSVVPHTQPEAIVTSGPYRLSRNPIYLGDVLILLGIVLGWGTAIGLVLVPAFAVLLDRRFIRAEEARLRARFPEAFDAYASRTRRWV